MSISTSGAGSLRRSRYRTKPSPVPRGRFYGGTPFTRGHLYRILQNHVYLGEVLHKDAAHRGEHPAVVERKLWDEVQQVMATNRRAAATGSRSESTSLLSGLVFDDAGNRMSPAHANKAGRRYRYYEPGAAATAQGKRGQPAAPAANPRGRNRAT